MTTALILWRINDVVMTDNIIIDIDNGVMASMTNQLLQYQ
jgi:hypothetical protein